MRLLIRSLIPLALAAALVGALFAPVVPYNASIPVPFPPFIKPGVRVCLALLGGSTGSTFVVNQTSGKQYQDCVEGYRYGPMNASSYASLAYRYLGLGLPPFPARMVVTEGNLSALVYFSGDRPEAARPLSAADTLIDPAGIVVTNSSIVLTQFGTANVTASFSNRSGSKVTDAVVALSFPGDAGNTTAGGVTWVLSNGERHLCRGVVTPGKTCSASMGVLTSLLPGAYANYTVLVSGDLAGRPFVTTRWFGLHLPSSVVNREWMGQFIALVDSARNGSSLVESPTLDRFAALRFNTSVTQPDISDYGLAPDVASFFGSSNQDVVEVLLYPGTSFPFAYAAYLEHYAPGHWSALTDANYTHFGYYASTAPYEFVVQPCSVSEIPRAGLNITQFFGQAGCSVTVRQATWLVIIMGR